MTEKLYYADAYCSEFTAVVTDCRERKSGYEVVLNRTAFYPEGGGQPGDRGALFVIEHDAHPAVGEQEKAAAVTGKVQEETAAVTGSEPEVIGDAPTESGCQIAEVFHIDAEAIPVHDTHENAGVILHYTDSYLAPGTIVAGKIDWDYRFDLMQNHSGEHIVSGLIHEKFGYHNVGFHMGSDVITIDLTGELTVEEMQEIERSANMLVWKNLPTDITVYDEESVKEIEYRSKKELHGEVRIVTFPEADVCACCGTHVRYTGEIGLIKLISMQKFKGGVRMEMLCGRRAAEYMNGIWEQNHQISVALSAKPKETAAAVQRLKEAEAAASFRMTALENELFAVKAANLRGAGNVLLFEEGLAPDAVRRLTVAVMEVCAGMCVVFSGDEENGYKYALGQENGDLRALVKEMNGVLKGRGGGKPFFAQGSVEAKRAQIEAFFADRI